MAWFKVDDQFWGHPKRLACSLSEIGLWVTAGSWSAQQLTDGRIPRHVLAVFGAKPKDAAGLVAAGLWLPVEGGWQFHDWHVFQPSRADVEKARQEAADRKAAWRARRAAERAENADVPPGQEQDTSAAQRPQDSPVPSASQDCPTYPDPDPIPTRPDPIRSSLREEQEDPGLLSLATSGELPSPAAPSTPFDRFWEWYPRKVKKAAARKAYDKAARRAGHDAILAGVIRYADDWSRDPAFTAHPTTWLNEGRWEDEGPVRPPSNVRPFRGNARVDAGDAILAEAFQRGAQQRPGLGA